MLSCGPSFALEGNIPGCNIDVQALAIPVGLTNVEAAYDFINWIMIPDQNVDFVVVLVEIPFS